ncbi:MAG: fibronectin type III domain-containing protein [Deltaproteobacteria bacterium]|nr:fibronectin type III domain-containing protein [Deltaproteobacteria bacterium]
MRNLKNIYRTIGCISLALMMLTLAGCGSSTSTPQPAATKTTETGSVTADGSGIVSASTPVAAPLGNTVTVQAGTVLTTDAAGTTPVTGTIPTAVSYSTTLTDLPAAAQTLPSGCTLAAFLDISMGTVKYFSNPLKLTMNVISGGAGVGDTVAFYTFNAVTNTWEPVDDAVVAADGTAALSIHHLSIWAAFKTTTPPPGKPSGISASAGNAKVTVSWTAPNVEGPSPVTSYNIYYSTAPGVTITTGTKITGAVSPCEIAPLPNTTEHFFVVTAVNANGEGGLSKEVSATPDESLQIPESPNGVVLTAGSGSVSVSWNTKLYATSYNIYYSDTLTTKAALLAGGTKYPVLATSADPQPATQSQVISPLTAGTTYYFVVTSQNSVGESDGQTTPKTKAPNP